MKQAVYDIFPSFSERFEGKVPWMYLDVKGLVTIWIGNLIDPVNTIYALPFVNRDTGEMASAQAIANEWLKVKMHPTAAKQGHKVLEFLTLLRLTDEGGAQLMHRKMEQNDLHLRRRFPEFESYPADAQLAIHSMAWACGPAFRFPRLEAAIKARLWLTAASECHMNEAGNPGLVPRNKANKILFSNALVAAEADLDPETLFYPRSRPWKE